MRVPRSLLPLCVLFICACPLPEGHKRDTADHESRPDSTTDDSGDSHETGATGDTGESGDTGGPVILSDLSWRLHDSIGSFVIVTWTQSREARVHVEYSFDEGEWHSAPEREGKRGTQEQILVGVPYGIDASWRVVAEDFEAEGEVLRTADAPTGLPLATVEVANPDKWLPEGKYLLTSINQDVGGWTGGTYWSFIVDRQGRPVWAVVTPDRNWTLFTQVSATRDYLLLDEATYWSDWDEGAGSRIHKRWLDEEFEVLAASGLHHAFVQLPDETLVWGSQNHGGSEALVEMRTDEVAPRVIWTCQEDWPGYRYCESNGLFYSVERDTFLYSFYTNNSIVEVDHATGESLWWAGTVADGYAFDPVDSQFSWQHGISYTEAGTLLVSTAARRTTWVREYEMDDENAELVEIWNYDPGIRANTNGDAWRLSNGNTLHLLGSAGYLNEVDPLGEPVWSLDFDGERLLGRGEYIEDLYTLLSPIWR